MSFLNYIFSFFFLIIKNIEVALNWVLLSIYNIFVGFSIMVSKFEFESKFCSEH